MAEPKITMSEEASHTLIALSGDWVMTEAVPAFEGIKTPSSVICDGSGVGQWDTSLVAYLWRLTRWGEQKQLEVRHQEMPEGVAALLKMTGSFKDKGSREEQPPSATEQVGRAVLSARDAVNRVAEFAGELCLSLSRILQGKAFFRPKDFIAILYDVGPGALPIVTLISFLVGLILAFVGAIQLRQFGAQIFVADLVGIAMAREMGGMMTAIIMAGRSSAAYAARIGTMQVNEEVDALRTTGLNAFDFLVLPRMLALLVTLPLLTLYAMAIGIVGGMCIGVFMLDLSVAEYVRQTITATSIDHFIAGFMKSFLFALVIAGAGCYHGLRCGRSSESVGRVTTIAVVTAIVGIVITDSVMTLVYDALDF